MRATIAHQDFVPEDETQTLDFSRRYEPLESVIERVNRWIAENEGMELVHIETLLLPRSAAKDGEGSTQSQVMLGNWFQVIRVWYRS